MPHNNLKCSRREKKINPLTTGNVRKKKKKKICLIIKKNKQHHQQFKAHTTKVHLPIPFICAMSVENVSKTKHDLETECAQQSTMFLVSCIVHKQYCAFSDKRWPRHHPPPPLMYRNTCYTKLNEQYLRLLHKSWNHIGNHTQDVN